MGKVKKGPDWEGIERDFSKTSLSIREIARWYGVSESLIRKKAKARNWMRPGAQNGAHGAQPIGPAAARVVERVVTTVDPEAIKPEAIVGRGRGLVVRMLDELEATTAHVDELEQQIAEDAPGPDNARRRDGMLKAISLSTRAQTLKNLALAAKTLAEASTPEGKKAQRQASADQSTSGGGKFAQRPGPRLVSSNP